MVVEARKKNRILIIVPAYNEAKNLPQVIHEVWASSLNVDVVVVNDGSTDETERVTREMGVPVLTLPFNLGIGAAVQTGFRFAFEKGYDIAVQVDGDGQHLPSEIGRLIDPIIHDRADVVIGSRFLGEKRYPVPLARRIGIRCFAWINSLVVGQRITDNTSGFRAYNDRAIRYLSRHYPYDYPEPEAVVILKKEGFRLAEVSVRMRERLSGTSSIGFLRSVYYMIKVTLAIGIDLLRSPRAKEWS